MPLYCHSRSAPVFCWHKNYNEKTTVLWQVAGNFRKLRLASKGTCNNIINKKGSWGARLIKHSQVRGKECSSPAIHELNVNLKIKILLSGRSISELLYLCSCKQWRIQVFPELGGGANPWAWGKILFFWQKLFVENCMKMKEFGLRRGGLAPPWISQR